jgi:GAF domain-containing protein
MSSSSPDAQLGAAQESAEEKLLDFYVKIMPPLMQCERCSIFVDSEKDGFVCLKAGTGQRERSIEVEIVENSIVGRVMEGGETIFEDRLQKMPGKHKHFEKQTGFESHDILCLPIKSLDGVEVVGAVQLLNHIGGGPYDEDEIALLEDHLDYLAFALDDAQKTMSVPSAVAVDDSRIWQRVAIGALIGCGILLVPTFLYLGNLFSS